MKIFVKGKKMNVPASVPEKFKKVYLENLERITHKTGRLMLFAGDQKIEHLNKDFYGSFIHPNANDPRHLFNIASQGRIGAFATHLGLISRYANEYKNVNYIVKLNGKTNLVKQEYKDPISRQLWSVQDVVEFQKNSGLKICGVGYTVYLGSEFETKMLHEAAQVVFQAHQNGLIAILWIYPRGKSLPEHLEPEIFSGATGVANALGSDFVKIHPSVDSKLFDVSQTLQVATKSAGNTKVICSGGESKATNIFLKELYDQINVGGASGSATGRNIFQRSLTDAVALTHAISSIVYDNKTFEEAMRIYQEVLAK